MSVIPQARCLKKHNGAVFVFRPDFALRVLRFTYLSVSATHDFMFRYRCVPFLVEFLFVGLGQRACINFPVFVQGLMWHGPGSRLGF